MTDKKVAVFRKESFNAAHRLNNSMWDTATNQKVFGMDMKVLSDLIKEQVIERFDHKNLNLDTKEFKGLNPTAENIAMVIYDLLRSKIDEKLQMQVRLYETPRNFVEYPAVV